MKTTKIWMWSAISTGAIHSGYCLLLTGVILLAWDAGARSQALASPSTTNRVLMVRGQVAGKQRVWMTVEANNGGGFDTRGFEPRYTRLVSECKPLFRKLANGSWEIMFTSEIAEASP